MGRMEPEEALATVYSILLTTAVTFLLALSITLVCNKCGQQTMRTFCSQHTVLALCIDSMGVRWEVSLSNFRHHVFK